MAGDARCSQVGGKDSGMCGSEVLRVAGDGGQEGCCAGLCGAVCGPRGRVRTEGGSGDSFGRWLSHVWWETAEAGSLFLSGHLVERDLATRWPTRWHETYDPERNLP